MERRKAVAGSDMGPTEGRGSGRRRSARKAQLSRHLRATWRLLRVDAPTVWRMASHATMLAVVLGVLLAARVGPRSAQAASMPADVGIATRIGERARAFVPQPVLETTSSFAPTAQRTDLPAVGFVSPGVFPEADLTLLPWDEPQQYVVASGDTLSEIAAQFGIEPERLLYFNPSLREDPHNLSVGDEITILPIDGVVHISEVGDTPSSVAEKYGARVADILGYAPNGLAEPDIALAEGSEVVVPNGEVDVDIPPYYQQITGQVVAGWAPTADIGPFAGTGRFHVASYGRFTRGFRWGHPAVDLAAPTGTPIYAIDSGTVEAAGWLGWTGNAVAIDHGNGYKSLFAHMNSVSVQSGQAVQRGQIIGTVGCTRGVGGYCTGPHLHLEVYYNGRAVDPCALGTCP